MFPIRNLRNKWKRLLVVLQDLPKNLVISLISLYQVSFAGLLGGRCRFFPSCSQYGKDAVRTHGFFKGGLMMLVRISKCHPWGPWGYDPVVKTIDAKQKRMRS